jgi:hypothetical protein
MCWTLITETFRNRFLWMNEPPEDPEKIQKRVDQTIEKASDVEERARFARLQAQATVMEGRKKMMLEEPRE